jgi:hypothetical protein
LDDSLVSRVWLADSLDGVFDGDEALKKKLCNVITRNKMPAIHIPGQILQPEPLMSHAMIWFPFKKYHESNYKSRPMNSRKVTWQVVQCELRDLVRLYEVGLYQPETPKNESEE